MWSLDLTNKQTNNFKVIVYFSKLLENILFQFWLCWHFFGYFTKRLMIMLCTCNMKNVLCSVEKSSVIWAEPHSRSSAEQFGWTERSVDHYYADSNSVNHSVNRSLCSFAYCLSNSQSFPANQQTAAKYVSFFGT